MTPRQAVLILTARESAVFSERAATEGEHRTLGRPTGASLLGWAARAYADPRFTAQDRYTLFHSGAVRFSDALPLTDSGSVAYPMPQILAAPKHRDGALVKDPADQAVRALNSDPHFLRVGRKPGDDEQYEPLGKGLFVTAGGGVVNPSLGSRLRTATKDGRAAEGSLFSYQHLSAAGEPRYAATLDADDVSDDVWRHLVSLFAGQTLYLGRASNGAHGGAYDCAIPETSGEAVDGVWPQGVAPAGTNRVRVWALSDLALVNAFGAPAFAPTAEMFGLPADWGLDDADSAIGVRRFAPWNGHLHRRDLERQVITAGSVMSFAGKACVSSLRGPGAVGLWRESGLGRVWLAPPLLSVAPGGAPATTMAPGLAPRVARQAAAVMASETDELIIWLKASAVRRRVDP